MADEPRVRGVTAHVVRADVPTHWTEPTASFVSGGTLLVEVLTDSEIVGWGEPSPYGAPLKELLRALDAIAPALHGLPIGRLSRVLSRVPVEHVHRYGRAPRNAVVAGLTQAAWDLVGKAARRPVYALLAEAMGTHVTGTDAVIDAYASAGMFFEGAPESAVIAEASALRDLGFGAYKLRPPTPHGAGSHFDRVAAPPPVDIDALVRRCTRIHEAVPELALMVDLGRRIPDVASAARLAQELEPLGVMFLEEPIDGTADDHRRLRQRITIPLAGGEQISSTDEFERWLESGALDLVQPDAGLASVDAIVSFVQRDPDRAARTLIPHSWTNPVCVAANAHVGVASRSPLVEANVTFNPLRTALVDAPLLPTGGRISVSERPGLGMEVDRAALKRFAA